MQEYSPYAAPQSSLETAPVAPAQLKVLSLKGRIGRLRYMAWLTATVLPAVLVGLLGTFAMKGIAQSLASSLLVIVVSIAVLVVTVPLNVQRLHDIGWSGWLFLLTFVPGVNSVFPLVMICAPGKKDSNRYGPPPPPNSLAVKVLATLWFVVMALVFLGAITGKFSPLKS